MQITPDSMTDPTPDATADDPLRGVSMIDAPPLPPAIAPDSAVMTCAVYRDGVRQDIAIEAISDVLAVDDGSFVWVGLYRPPQSLLAKLQEEFNLHDLAVEDAEHAHQRPKIEAYGNSLFIALHTAQRVDDTVCFGETHIFLGPRFLITVRHGASLSYRTVRERFEREPDLLLQGPSFALYGVLDFIVDNYRPIVDGFAGALDTLERDILSTDYRRDTIVRLYALRKELTRLRLAVAPLQDILAQLARTPQARICDEARVYYRDVLDHVVRLNEAIDTQREMMAAAMNVNLALVTLHQGEVVKRLAGWAALLAAPTLVASWYGMNFRHMPELDEPYAYAVLIGGMVAVCSGLYLYLKKVRWL